MHTSMCVCGKSDIVIHYLPIQKPDILACKNQLAVYNMSVIWSPVVRKPLLNQ